MYLIKIGDFYLCDIDKNGGYFSSASAPTIFVDRQEALNTAIKLNGAVIKIEKKEIINYVKNNKKITDIF